MSGNKQGNRGMPAPPVGEMPSLPGEENAAPELPGMEEKSSAEQLPEGVDPKPLLQNPKGESSSVKEVKQPKKGIDVVAVRPGYYRMSRRATGDEFKIVDMSELGSWMRLADPAAEKKRQDDAKAKKMAERAKRQAEFEAKLKEKEEAGK